MITIFDLALSLSRQVSHSLLARGLQLSFSSDQSHPSQWLTNILLVNPSDAPHVKSHQRKMLIFFTRSCRDSGKILNSQMKNSFSRRSPSRVRPRRKRARLPLIVLLQLPQTIFVLLAELEIRLTEAQNQKLALELEVLRLRRADGSADVNTENSGTQPTSEKTRKKRTVDWPHEFAPGSLQGLQWLDSFSDSLIRLAHAASTYSNMQSHLKLFTQFCNDLGHQPFPVQVTTILRYLAFFFPLQAELSALSKIIIPALSIFTCY